jgi:hypothetical protein
MFTFGLSILILLHGASAFAMVPTSSSHTTTTTTTTTAAAAVTTTTTSTRLQASNSDSLSDLTSSLARLDQQWKIQQASGRGSRWTKLFLPKDQDPEEVNVEAEDVSSTFPTTNDSEDYVWLLEPPSSSIPSCILVFTGGAGLGQFPQVAYNELLTRVSDRLNALCIAAPYSVGLDHFALAKQTGERIRRALVYLQDDDRRPYITESTMPRTYALAHSLGCKLQTIYVAATGQEFDGIGFLAYNNFSFAKTIQMARTFAQQLRQSTTNSKSRRNGQFGSSTSGSDDLINGILDFAEMAVGAIGVDFSPNARDTERLIELRYDDRLQSKTRVFVFDDDNLDSSQEFVKACSGGLGPSLCGLPGGHLAPVFFQWSMDDLAGFDENNIPLEAREMAKEALGGFQSASFGDETSLNALVDAICGWILGQPPGRDPIWASNVNELEIPKIAGSSTSSTSTADE